MLLLTSQYIRENEYNGHVLGPPMRYGCSRCLIAQNSRSQVGPCEGKPHDPPFYFCSGKPPNDKTANFCKNGHKGKWYDLSDADVIECRASTAHYSATILISKASGIADTYQCSHCHVKFESKCKHSMC